MSSYTVYWGPDGWHTDDEGSEYTDIAGSNQFRARGVKPDDTLYFVNFRDGEVRLLGKMIVGKYITPAEARASYGEGIWAASDYVVEREGTAAILQVRPVPAATARQLRFLADGTEVGLTLNRKGEISTQTLRGVRQLAPASAALLDVLFEEEDFEVSEEAFQQALVAIWPTLGESRRRMLEAHYAAPEHTATMRELAHAAGYEGWQPANSQYGALGHDIADLTGYPTAADVAANGANWVRAIGWLSGKSDRGPSEWAWTMHPEMVTAIKALGLFGKARHEGRVSADPLDMEDFDDAPETERVELRKARVGQGKFRDDVIAYWGRCAVTGCNEVGLLVASHIKPWRDSSHSERLDGFNGLLLTPNLDKLFDLGWITFDDDGTLVRSPLMSDKLSRALGLGKGQSPLKLDRRHQKYLRSHRESVFRK